VDNYRYVFIVTYGRSGSTLLMSILNTIPGYRVNGENYAALYRLYQASAAITEAHRMCANKPRHTVPTSPWYGIVRARPQHFRRELVTSFVTHVLRPVPGDRVLGFKEIRYTKSSVSDLGAFLAFLRGSFPGCKIIFNHRELTSVAQSSWWALDKRAVDKLVAADARMLAVPGDQHHLHFWYDEIDDGLDNLRGLFRFLGEEFDEPAVRRVLATRHSPPPRKYLQAQEGLGTPATQHTQHTQNTQNTQNTQPTQSGQGAPVKGSGRATTAR
jgi:hypothetical protein